MASNITNLPYLERLLRNEKPAKSLLSYLSPQSYLTNYARTAVYKPLHFGPLEKTESFTKLKNAGLAIEVKELTTRDKAKVEMWFAKHPNKDAPTKIFFHGRKANIANTVDKAIKAHEQGCNVSMFDYRNESQEEGIINDALAIFEELIDRRKIPAETIDIDASSFGTTVALHALAKRSLEINKDFHDHVFVQEPLGKKLNRVKERFNHLTLKSPFSNLKELSKYQMKFLPHWLKKYFLEDIWNNLEAIRHLANIKHITFLHGDKDELIPIKEALNLFEFTRALGVPANFITAKDETHRIKDSAKYLSDAVIEASLPYRGNYAHFSDGKNTHFKEDGQEHAIDILMPIGTAVHAMKAGKVIKIIDHHPDAKEDEAVSDFNTMNEILIEDEEGIIQNYAHIQQSSTKGLIKEGSVIKAGQEIGKSGHNGVSSEPHLHCSIGKKDSKFDRPELKIPGHQSMPIKFLGVSAVGS